jgi:ribosomal protein S6--L-glutamate ligase
VAADEMTLGWEEWAALPDLGLPAILAKTDTGARSCALHAVAIEPFGPIGRPKVRFVVQPWPERPDLEIVCAAPLIDRREVVSSNGESELRHFIRTRVRIGERTWPVEMSLTDRRSMRYRMLIGRQALDSVRIDPASSFLQPPLSYDLYAHTLAEPPPRRTLRIALLTMAPDSYSVRKLIAAAEARDHVVEVIETRRCYMNINTDRPQVCYDGKALPQFDAVLARIGAPTTAYGAAVVRQFAMTGAYCLNTAEAITASRDKLYAHQLLARAGVRMPVTAFARSPDDTDHVIRIVGNAPLVVKLVQGSQGRGVVLAETRQAARSVISAFQALSADILVQEFVAEARGVDVRCVVIGNKVVAAMMRRAAAGDFRANLHSGGVAEAVKVTREEREIALKATRVLGLEVAGVDILRAEGGPKVLEVNSSPGLEGIEAASGVDVAAGMIAHLERRLRADVPLRSAGRRRAATAR